MIKLTIQETNQEPREVEFKEGLPLGLIANSYGVGTKLIKAETMINLNEISKFDEISEFGALEYLSCHIESLQDRIAKDDPRKPLYDEQIMFFGKIKKMCEKHINSTSRV
jgi:hypothetical protein